MPMINVRRFFAAVILAGLFVIIGGAGFAGGDLSALHYVASFGHSDILLSFAGAVSVLHLAVDKGDIAEVKGGEAQQEADELLRELE
ncbi:MAG: hypothetical protein ACR2P4_03880 [Gammaproteobacteria bacterium]